MDCFIDEGHSLYSFDIFPHHFLQGSNAAGYYLEDVDHKTVEECAQLCLDDAGCKSFDAGVPGLHQEGDCFISYDNRRHLDDSNFVAISQLSYYERRDMPDVIGVMFERSSGCFLTRLDEGGVFLDSHTPETCAQRCLTDTCCKSFEAGVGNKYGQCYLSYSDRHDAPAAFTCDPGAELNYFEKLIFVEVPLVGGPLYNSLGLEDSPAAYDSFAAAATAALSAVLSLDPVDVSVTLSTSTTGHPMVTPRFRDASAAHSLEDIVTAGLFTFLWPALIGDRFTGTNTATEGLCKAGTVSQTGHRFSGCRICRSNTYSNQARTRCEVCPSETVSNPGSTSVLDCKRPAAYEPVSSIFAKGDEWIGIFNEGPQSTIQGAMTLEVVRVIDAAGGTVLEVEFLASLAHGQYCDESLDCRTAGVSQFYYVGVMDGPLSLNLTYVRGFDGWSGITDRSFPRQDLQGAVTITDETTAYSGEYGPVMAGGTFYVSRRCSAAEETSPLVAGDKWVGTYACDRDSGGVQGDKALQGEKHVQRMHLLVESVSDDRVVAVVDFDHGTTTSQYVVSGRYNLQDTCQVIRGCCDANNAFFWCCYSLL